MEGGGEGVGYMEVGQIQIPLWRYYALEERKGNGGECV